MENKPLISIVLPTCNRLNFLHRSIDSIKVQTYENWELHIIDDISEDGTKEAMTELQKKDSRINYHRIKVDNTPGISKYLNYGITKAKGKYIARLDDDDFWCENDKLKMQVEFLENNPDYVLVGGGMIIIDEEGVEKFRYLKNEKDDEIREKALMSNPFTHAAVMYRKDAIESIGGYKNLIHAEDWDMWLRLGKVGKFHNFKLYFGKYLVAGQNKSFQFQRRQAKVILKIIREHRKHYPHFLKGYSLNLMQYIYTYFPFFIRKRLQMFLYYFKRKYF
jgi:glycosyltransferase involved in cell wall biosynthesis